jgi:predicted hydrocarbon binding protein
MDRPNADVEIRQRRPRSAVLDSPVAENPGEFLYETLPIQNRDTDDAPPARGRTDLRGPHMHGILFKYLKEYVEAEYDHDAWEAAMDEAEIEPKLYLPVTEYPDDEAVRLVDGVVSVTGAEEGDLLEEYGEVLAPELLDTFNAHIRDDWDAFDLLEHSGNQVFDVFYSEDGDEDEVTATRVGEDTVVLHYGSSLELCGLATGVLRGIAEEHGEDVRVTEDQCMHSGADHCEISVSRA